MTRTTNRCLVGTIRGDHLQERLARAYVILGHAFLSHRNRLEAIADRCLEPADLDHYITRTEKKIDLRAAKAECDLIGPDYERPSEVFNNLRHMFVLLTAVSILKRAGFRPTSCAPTQQSRHQGERLCDLQGDDWVLEAFGGVDIRNNGKLAKDFRTLSNHYGQKRTLLAVREDALRRVERRITATKRVGSQDGVVVLEIDRFNESEPPNSTPQRSGTRVARSAERER